MSARMSGPRVSVAVCTRDRADDLRRVLGSLAAQKFDEFEVLIIDQSLTEATGETVKHFEGTVPNLRYVRLTQPGLSGAYNRAVREARGDLLAFTDDDCRVPENWVRKISDVFASEGPDVVYGQVLVPPEFLGTPTAAMIPTLLIERREELSRDRGFRVVGMGANFAARRSMIERVGGFDEMLGGGGPLQSTQDFDFAYRVFRSGGTIVVDPDIYAYHYGIRPREEWPRLMESYGIGVGGFYCKHLRLGDIRAAGLFAKAAVRALGEAARATAVGGSDARGRRQFVISMAVGMRRSFDFPIDKTSRVYVRPRKAAGGAA
jgi:glycosyltransferase involved in cell wall biosynthesis